MVAGHGVRPGPRRVEAYLLEKLQGLFPPAGADHEAEAVHRMRVNSRRLRVGLRFFSAPFDPRELKLAQRQLRRITRELGEIRALDINLQLLRRAASHWPPATEPTQALLEQALLVERRVRLADLRKLGQTLNRDHFEQHLRRLITRSQPPDPAGLRKDCTGQLRELRRALRRRARQFRRRGTSRSFHKFRIAVKHYRYGLEASRAVLDVRVDDRIRTVESLQDLMGDCHDVEVLVRHLRGVGERLGATDKVLADHVRLMVRHFQREHDKRFARFERFLEEERSWSKKVRWRVPHE